MGNWFDNLSKRPPDPTMIPRLRIAIRVVSEDEYLANLAKGPPGPGLYSGEKKFPIVISNPQQWQIGHLVAEIKRQFRQIYGRDIGTIKYISHGFDDCQLHKHLSVYDHLYDEGRARTDPSDQHVVVKAVYSLGRPLREGSVLPDFNDPQYEHRPIPPVPTPSWPKTSLKYGKRSADDDGDDRIFRTHGLPDVKRQRMNDLDDADSDDDVAQSIEQDGQMQTEDGVLSTSQTVIHDSQSSPGDDAAQSFRQPSLPLTGLSPLHSSYDTSFSGPLSPLNAPKADQISESSADLPQPVSRQHLLSDSKHSKLQALLTPPSGASKKTSSGVTKPKFVTGSIKKSSRTQAASSGLRRPSAIGKSIYDIDEPEDIECSLMSPNSKRATSKKVSRSSSGSKSSRGRKDKDLSDRFNGTITSSEIVKLMDDGGIIQPESSTRLCKVVSCGSPVYNLTADEDGYSQQGDVFQAQNAVIATSYPADDYSSQAQGQGKSTGPFTTFSMPMNARQPENIPSSYVDDVDMKDETAAPSPKVNLQQHEDKTESKATAAPEKISVAPRKDSTIYDQTSTAAATKQAAEQEPGAKRRKKRKSKISGDGAAESLKVDTAGSQLDTKQSTPVDSPGEQLLEMQASSQKSREGSQTQKVIAEKRAEKRARKLNKKKRPEQVEDIRTPKMSAADKKRTHEQRPRLDQKAPAEGLSPAVVTKASEEPARSDTASKSPYARRSPPEGSIGLGFTNSPRRPSTVSTESASLGKRNLFENKPPSADLVRSEAVRDSDSSSDSVDESSDSVVATPSKQARPEKPQTPYQKFIAAKATPTLQKSESTKSESSRSASVPLPPGMTLDQFEAKKKQHEDAFASGKEVPKGKSLYLLQKERQARADLALLARTVSKESTSSVTPSETLKQKPKKKTAAKQEEVAVVATGEPKPKKKRASKNESTENGDLAATDRTTTTVQFNTTPAGTAEKEQKKATKPTAKTVNASSTTASLSSKASQPASAKLTLATATPSVALSISQASEPGSLLKNLKHRMANKSAKNSSAPPTFAPAPKPAAKTFVALEDDSDDDESSSDEGNLEEKTTKIKAASRPDASTRNVQQDSDDDEDEDSD